MGRTPTAQRRFASETKLTLEDADDYVTKLPKAEHEATEWPGGNESVNPRIEHGPAQYWGASQDRADHAHRTASARPSRQVIARIAEVSSGHGFVNVAGRFYCSSLSVVAVITAPRVFQSRRT